MITWVAARCWWAYVFLLNILSGLGRSFGWWDATGVYRRIRSKNRAHYVMRHPGDLHLPLCRLLLHSVGAKVHAHYTQTFSDQNYSKANSVRFIRMSCFFFDSVYALYEWISSEKRDCMRSRVPTTQTTQTCQYWIALCCFFVHYSRL